LNKKIRSKLPVFLLLISAALALPALADDLVIPDSETLMKALNDELARSMEIQLEDLEKPYFIQFSVNDSITQRLVSQFGTLTSSYSDRSRQMSNQVRIGSYELDNTNFSGGDSGGFGGFTRRRRGGGGFSGRLPISDDYIAIRQAIWRAVDSTYKSGVETYSQKVAYLKDYNIVDRPHDFTKTAAAVHKDPPARLAFDEAAWKAKIKKLSGIFKQFPQAQDSSVQLTASAENRYIVNSEGAQIRTAQTSMRLSISLNVQSEKGKSLNEALNFFGKTANDIPEMETIAEQLKEQINILTNALKAPTLDSYTGPVLFDGKASAQLFRSMLSRSFAGRPETVGAQRVRFDGTESLESKLNQRILPKTFRVYDDPTMNKAGSTLLAGCYVYDDEGVKAERVELVSEGKLKNMLLSRTPTLKFSGSNGHGRGAGGSRAAIASLFIEDDDAVTDEELKAALIEAAKDQGLEYGLRVTSLSAGGGMANIRSMMRGMSRGGGGGGRSSMSDPVIIYKIYVEDGREEMVSNLEFVPIKTRDLKDIIASSKSRHVLNSGGGSAGSSIVAPAVVFEEMELNSIREESPRTPVLPSPLMR